MKPYYSEKGIELYVGDSRKVLPRLNQKFTSVITDPVWPNVPGHMQKEWGVKCPFKLLQQTSIHFPLLAPTTVIILGCNSDPRFLNALPDSLPFIRQSFIEYRVPCPKGRILNGHDVVYSFGAIPSDMPGFLLPGRYVEKANDKRERRHPCPRNLHLMKWVVKWYAGLGPFIDPFSGSGTSLLAAKILGIAAVGIEKKKEYADITIDRLQKIQLFDFGVEHINKPSSKNSYILFSHD
jgi:hypothetical protein